MRTLGPPLAVILGILSCGLSAQVPSPQEADEKVEQAILSLETALAEKNLKMQSTCIEALAASWSSADPKQRQRIRNLAKTLLGSRESDIRRVTLEAMGRMGGGQKQKDAHEATLILLRVVADPIAKDDDSLLEAALGSLGQLAHPKAIESLTSHLNHKETKVVVAAATGLSHYAASSTVTRKELFKKLLRSVPAEPGGGGGRTGAGGGQARPANALFDWERRQAIQAAVDKALTALTGEKLRGPEEWNRWWNDVGKRKPRW